MGFFEKRFDVGMKGKKRFVRDVMEETPSKSRGYETWAYYGAHF
jgi:hypothetical protein